MNPELEKATGEVEHVHTYKAPPMNWVCDCGHVWASPGAPVLNAVESRAYLTWLRCGTPEDVRTAAYEDAAKACEAVLHSPNRDNADFAAAVRERGKQVTSGAPPSSPLQTPTEVVSAESPFGFRECDACRANRGSPNLCEGCLTNRSAISALRGEVAALRKLVDQLTMSEHRAIKAANEARGQVQSLTAEVERLKAEAAKSLHADGVCRAGDALVEVDRLRAELKDSDSFNVKMRDQRDEAKKERDDAFTAAKEAAVTYFVALGLLSEARMRADELAKALRSMKARVYEAEKVTCLCHLEIGDVCPQAAAFGEVYVALDAVLVKAGVKP